MRLAIALKFCQTRDDYITKLKSCKEILKTFVTLSLQVRLTHAMAAQITSIKEQL